MRRRLVLPIVLFAIAGPAVSAQQSAVDPERMLAQAEALNAKGGYRDTIALLGSLERDPALQPLQRARLLCHLGIAQASTSQHEAALRSADEAERLARPSQDAELLARVALVRGSVARVQVGPLSARDHYETAVRWATQAERPPVLSAAYSGLASVAQQLGDWSRVLYYAQQAWEANPSANPLNRHRYAIQRGVAFYEVQESEASERSFKEALAIAEEAGNRHGVSLALGELGLVYDRIEDRAKALDHFDRAIALAREIGVPDLEVTWLLNSGNVFRGSGDLAKALRRYHRGLDLERKTGQVRSLPILLKNIGQTLALAGRHAEAEPYLLDALAQADRQNTLRIRWQARMELGALFSGTDPTRADRYFSESLDALEEQHNNLLLEDFRVGALSRSLTTYDPYDLYVAFLLDRGDTRKAFLVAERARARAFLDTLRAAREQLAAAVSPEYLAAERDVLRRISSQQTELRTGQPDAQKRQAIAAAVQKDEEALTALRLKLATEQPAIAAARYPRLLGVDELQRSVLRDDEALVLFFVGRRGSAAWIVTRDKMDVARLPARTDLEPPLREYLETLQRPGDDDHRETGARLWKHLTLDRLGGLPNSHRLIVVPHGILNYLPFEAVMDQDGRYLVERHAVSYSPSASSFAYLRSQPRHPAGDGHVVTVGNPVIGGSAPAAAERGVRADRIDLLKPLAHAGYELREVAAMFGRRGRVLEREQATESALAAADLQRAVILHFATHGLIDEEHPERSTLALSAQPPQSDGLLQMREIYGLRLGAALVTLSACQTALGKDITGEGIVGFARAFFYAGANAVMASLWNVNDASTAQFMTMFYEKLSRGETIDRAAREAKLRFLRADDTKLRHPYYWAPFIVSGNAAVDVPVGSFLMTQRAVVGTTVAMGVLIVAGYVIARRRREQTPAAPSA